MKEKIRNLFAILFLLFCCFTLSNVANSETEIKETKKTEANLENKFCGKSFVIDGDSIRVDENEVRLLEIDAPEYKQTCFDANNQEYSCGKISKSFLINFINKKDVCCFYNKKDRYDRFLGKCFIAEKSINEEILKNGMAIIYDIKSVDERIIKIEEEARKNKRGIWVGAFQIPKEYRKENKRK